MTKLWHKWISWIRAKQPMNTSKLQTRYSVIEYRYSSVPDPKGDKEKDGNLAYFNVIGSVYRSGRSEKGCEGTCRSRCTEWRAHRRFCLLMNHSLCDNVKHWYRFWKAVPMFGLSSASTRFTEMYMRGNVIIVVNGYLTLWGKPRVRHVGLVLPTGGYRIYPLSLTPKSSITAPLFDRALWYSRVSPKVRREYIINKKMYLDMMKFSAYLVRL